MFVETDFLFALVNEDDWLHTEATAALETYDDIHTSILAYAELLVLLYDRQSAGFEIDVGRAITNLLEVVRISPTEHEDAVLAAADFIEEFDLTPFDALHAGMIVISGDQVLSTEQDYDALGLDRVSLEPE